MTHKGFPHPVVVTGVGCRFDSSPVKYQRSDCEGFRLRPAAAPPPTDLDAAVKRTAANWHRRWFTLRG